MMSDEEKVGETFVRHPPAYRSDRLNAFINKLDARLSKTTSSHARHPRVLGSPVTKKVPSAAKSWMVKEQPIEETTTSEANRSHQDLFETSGTESSAPESSDSDD